MAVIEPRSPICTEGIIISPLVRDSDNTSWTRRNTVSMLLKELKIHVHFNSFRHQS